MTKANTISQTQLAALRRYDEATMDGTAPCLTGPGGSVRSGTHCALLRMGLLEVAVLRTPVSVQHTYGYNFGRIRITKSHLENDSRFRLDRRGPRRDHRLIVSIPDHPQRAGGIPRTNGERTMHRAKKIERAGHSGECWQYRGGFMERHPPYPGSRGNWHWQVCGAGGWVTNRAQAKERIDKLLESARAILEQEAEVQS